MKYRARNRFSEAITPLQEELSELCNVSWITIHRHRGPLESERTREYESTVDKKLSTISSQLSQYFASLQKRVSEETEKFQERVFLSLLYEEKQEALLSTVRELDIASERDALGEIFRELRVKDKTFQPKLKKHFDHLNRSLKKFDEENRLELDDLFVIINMWRIHSIVSDWHDLTKEKEHIFSPRDTFLNVLNEMMNRKQIDIDDANELYAITQSGKEFPVYELSSGEKQIVILLGECLLQRNENWIYIADEPELSLHVAWQRQLVSNLKRLNENAQVIFATHSPDIVGPYSDRIHHMEESIS
jgi:ABC-type dipeptide/oligopeptide/nickel transport system ATPase component